MTLTNPTPNQPIRTLGDSAPEPRELDAAADLARLLKALDKIEPFVRPPLVRSIAGLHSGSEHLLVVKSHRWKNFTETVRKIRARHPTGPADA